MKKALLSMVLGCLPALLLTLATTTSVAPAANAGVLEDAPPSTYASAPNGIEYGSSGSGNPQTADCDRFVDSGQSITSTVADAGEGDVICVRAGDYSSQLVSIRKARVTVRANGVARIRGADIRADGAVLDGFTVSGGPYDNPRSGIRFAGTGIKVVNNVVRGGNLEYGISCERNACDRGLVARNSVTGIESIGLFIENGTGTVVEYNNIYDLHRDRTSYDVDGIRFWGSHTFRFNYIHDINEYESNGNPHVDCFQTYNNGTTSSGTLIENNYCLRVSRQCLIAQNNSASSYQIRNIIFRNNVCETYDSQGINLGSMSGVQLYNNLLISGFRYQIVNLEVMGPGLANTNTTIRNNVMIRAKSSATTYRRNGRSTDEHFDHNLERTDTSLDRRDDDFHASHGPYPAQRDTDFTNYRNYTGRLTVVDQGTTGNNSAVDIDAQPRIRGARIDIGPFELG